MKRSNVKCPTCEKLFEYYSSEFRPFCSDKCKNVDLNMWFDEEYKVPSNEIPLELYDKMDDEYEH